MRKITVFCLLILIAITGCAYAENIWIEAENTSAYNWHPGIARMICQDGAGASNGMYVRLYNTKSTEADANLPFHVDYIYKVSKEGDYNLWIAANPQNASWCSTFYLKCDNQSFINLKGLSPSGASYGAPFPEQLFIWTLAYKIHLKPGKHTLRFEVRSTRESDTLYAGFIDAILLTTDLKYVPEGNHPDYSPQPTWQERMKKTTYDQYIKSIDQSMYFKAIQNTNENISASTAAEVERKIMARSLPNVKDSGIHRFGVHGMEMPFVEKGKNDVQAEYAFRMLARTGVDTLRTAESCWHRLGDNYNNFKQLDYQVEQASKYGMNFMFTVGYPSGPCAYTGGLTTIKADCEPQFRDYIQMFLERYKGHYQYIEYCNEVDAPVPWWIDATSDMYTRDCRILKEEMLKTVPNVPMVAFASTYARKEDMGGPDGGRNFVRHCFDLGINKYADAYSLHYTWSLGERDFPAFFRREMASHGGQKPLINSEEAGYGQPYDVIKVFARDLFLYDMQAVYYYLGRDWFEAGNLISSGLFDINWRPKLRLLAYAASVDAIKHRRLIGMAKPASGVEAYVLEYENKSWQGSNPKYSIVVWKNGQIENLGPAEKSTLATKKTVISGLPGLVSANTWKLDRIEFDKKQPSVTVGDAPVMLYTNKLPKWNIMSAVKWLELTIPTKKGSGALVPGQ